MNNIVKIFAILSLPLLLNACFGGGGGSSSSSSNPQCGSTSATSSFCTSEFNAQYGLVTTKAYEAFDDGYDGDGIKVAVLDGGFDTSHADLDANIITGYDEEDDDNTPNAESHNATMGGHGTHVAGIIAAEKNGTGMMGIAYNASIMPIKIFQDSGTFVTGGINNSIDYATDNGAIALNNSWGSSRTVNATCSGVSCYVVVPAESSTGGFTADERTAWASVASDNNVVVFAAGNNGMNSVNGKVKAYRRSDDAYITSYDAQVVVDALSDVSYVNRSTQEAQYGVNVSAVAENWLNVVALDNTNTIASYSNACGNTKAYCIAAPGSSIYSTVPTDLVASGYDTYNGTSMAAPHVSGAIAVMKEKWPNLTGAQIVDLIIGSATDLGESGVDEVYGVGMLNMAGAMTATTAQSFSYVGSNGNLQKIEKNGSISANSILSNLASKNVAIGFVDSYDRVYSNRSNQFNSLKEENITDQQNFFKFRNGITDTGLNTYLNMSFVDYGNNHENFDLKYRSYSFQEDDYQNILLGDNIMTVNLFNNFTISTNPINENNSNSLLLKTSFSSVNPKSQNIISFGYGYEQNRLLNSEFTGAFAAKNNNTLYASMFRKQKISEKGNLNFKIGYGVTKSNFSNQEFFNMSDLETSSASIGYIHSEKNSKFALSLEAPLSISSGQANYMSVSGYDSEGNYKNSVQTIGLTPDQRELKLSLYFDKVINKNSNYGIAASQSNSGSNNLQFIFSKTF
jgi:subtilisin family serine protease